MINVSGEAEFAIRAVDADWDDETEQVELRVTLVLNYWGDYTLVLSFQVMTFCVA